MNDLSRWGRMSLVVFLAVVSGIGLAQLQATGDDASQTQGPELPPGWTHEDMMAAAAAGTPGPMHVLLAKSVGKWQATTTMWITPQSEPVTSEGTATYTSLMEGRYVQAEMIGTWEGMGEYRGMGLYGYDNVAEEFQSIWIDNYNTGMTRGTGELSDDGTTITWKFTYHCPLTEKPSTMREVVRYIDDDHKTLVAHAQDPKTGEIFKMMEIDFQRINEPE